MFIHRGSRNASTGDSRKQASLAPRPDGSCLEEVLLVVTKDDVVDPRQRVLLSSPAGLEAELYKTTIHDEADVLLDLLGGSTFGPPRKRQVDEAVLQGAPFKTVW